MPRNDFERQLEIGRVGERMVVGHLQSIGCGVVPSYDFTGSDGKKAPRLMFKNLGLVVPDLDAAKSGARRWVEVKTYEKPVEYRRLGILIHGIKRRHYDDYLAVERETGNQVYLAVLEVDSGLLLSARLAHLKPQACFCRCYQEGRPQRWCQVYFDRQSFFEWHRFSDAEMADLRAMREAAA